MFLGSLFTSIVKNCTEMKKRERSLKGTYDMTERNASQVYIIVFLRRKCISSVSTYLYNIIIFVCYY